LHGSGIGGELESAGTKKREKRHNRQNDAVAVQLTGVLAPQSLLSSNFRV